LRRYIQLRHKKEWGVRQYERIIRIALSIARIRRRNCTVKDFLDSIKLVDPEMPYGIAEALERFVEGLE